MKKRAIVLGWFSSASSKPYRSVCEDLTEHLESIGWQMTWASRYYNRFFRLLDTLWTIVRKRANYDVAHVDIFSGLAFRLCEVTCWVLRLGGVPYVITLHGGNLPQFSQRNPKRVSNLLRSAAKVTAPSRYLFDALKPFREDILLIPNPLELANYPFRVRAEVAPRVLWLRSFHKQYNPVLAIKVIDQLRHTYPDIQLTMVEPDKEDGALQQVQEAIQTLGVEKHVQIVGGVPKSEVPQWLDRFDIFLNTTNFDNTPISVMESMASGMCIVTTNVGGIPALVTDHVEGLLVPPDDVEAMRGAIECFLSDSQLAARLSAQAHKRAEGFDWGVILKQWDTLLTEVAYPLGVDGSQ